MSNTDNLASGASWLRNVGHLRPWEVSDANKAVREYSLANARRLMAMVAKQVATVLREPLLPSDVETILATAANVRGVFAGVEDARDLAHEVRGGSQGWTLVLQALDGADYAELLSSIESEPTPPQSMVWPETTEVVLPEGLMILTADVAAAYVSNNTVEASDVPSVIQTVYRALAGVGAAKGLSPEPQKPAVPIKKSITPDYLISLEDGRKYKSLKRHLRTQYNMSPDDYRAKWGLPKDYPMVAPNYAASRSALAKSMGLGGGGRTKGVRSRATKKAAV